MVECDVVIIGAGVAGLAAASKLTLSGMRVIVLEAKDRIGGRVLWADAGRGDLVELGAEFIHGPAPETRELLHATHQNWVEVGGESWEYRDGKLAPNDSSFERAFAALANVNVDGPDQSVDDYLQSSHDDAETTDAVRALVEGFDAANTADASINGIAAEWRSGVDSVSARPNGSYADLVGLLKKRTTDAGGQILLRTPVTRVGYGDDGVSVETADETYRARAVISTLPIGVLRAGSVGFDPPLPPQKTTAIEMIASGDVARVVLIFRTAFWERIDHGRYRNASFFRWPGGPFPTFWTQHPLRDRSIVAWAGGPLGAQLLDLPHDTLIRRALDGFGAMFDQREFANEQFERAFVHDWSGDPFARGAYSYLRVGGGDARAVLGGSVGERLFFAGEATATDGQSGTVNGAIVSGYRTAGEIIAAFKGAKK